MALRENLPQLEDFLDVINAEVRTTRRASELFMECPALPYAVEGERLVKATIDRTYAEFVTAQVAQLELPEKSASTPEDIHATVKNRYWSRAQHVTSLSGAKPGFILKDYFHVQRERHTGAICESVRAEHDNASVPVQILDSVEQYVSELGVDTTTAARIATTHLMYALPRLKKLAEKLATEGHSPAEATRLAVNLFATRQVSEHISSIQDRAQEGKTVSAYSNKRSFYPESESDDKASPLVMTQNDAKGLMDVYRLERRPFSDEELALGEEIFQSSRMQIALLLFQESIVDFSSQYLAVHPERLEFSLLPFSEFFVLGEQQDGNLNLLPNPKLLKVLGNNLLPAIASVLLQENTSMQDLSPEQIGRAAQEAKDRRVFQAQIGKFNNLDRQTGLVELDAIFKRVCPAMQMLTDALTRHLPEIYKNCSA